MQRYMQMSTLLFSLKISTGISNLEWQRPNCQLLQITTPNCISHLSGNSLLQSLFIQKHRCYPHSIFVFLSSGSTDQHVSFACKYVQNQITSHHLHHYQLIQATIIFCLHSAVWSPSPCTPTIYFQYSNQDSLLKMKSDYVIPLLKPEKASPLTQSKSRTPYNVSLPHYLYELISGNCFPCLYCPREAEILAVT